MTLSTTRTALFAHLDAAVATVSTTARATVTDAPNAAKELAHIDAAAALMTAATEMFHAALDIAAGCSVSGHRAPFGAEASRLATSLRIAEGKAREAGMLLDKGEAREQKKARKLQAA